MQQIKIITPILLVIIFTLGILSSSNIVSKTNFVISNNSFINFYINHQLFLLGIALISMMSSYILNPESFKSILSIGNISAIGEELKNIWN